MVGVELWVVVLYVDIVDGLWCGGLVLCCGLVVRVMDAYESSLE